jgi:hypothetical protein
VLDAHIDEATHERRIAGKMYQLVMPRPAGHVTGVGLPSPIVIVRSRRNCRLDEDLDIAIDPLPVALEANLLLDRQ